MHRTTLREPVTSSGTQRLHNPNPGDRVGRVHRDLVTVCTVDGRAAVAWLERQWPALYEQDPSATPYSAPGWLAGWASQLSRTATPLLLIAMDSTGVRGALALARERRSDGAEVVQPLSASCEYLTVVGPGSADQRVAHALVRRLTGLARTSLVTLPQMPARSPLAQAIQDQPGWQHTTSPTAVVPLPLDVDALPKTIRRQHTRREQKLAHTTVAYRRTGTADALLAALPTLVALHAAQHPADDLAPQSTLDAWSGVLRHCADSAFIAEATLDNTVIASQLCLYRARHCYSLLPAMHPAYRHMGPGHALLRWLAGDLAADGYTRLNLGPTRPTPEQLGYKAQYAPIWDSNVTSTSVAVGTAPGTPAPPAFPTHLHPYTAR
ncbi:GNAT family N-acetyltransferase [Streptomyces arenae]|uniref:GNAT family N-acetyltransferase n=1 Tax=Streptomyces arenae TaxID=29301 RepID=UPI002659EE49|nr:GNAT family N-acetyltransferase [Streptomyces arenae]MCG7202298.1 GNAT family N-acetyltransferase [Streptomyces arenae]